MNATADLFWEPAIGDLVMLRPHARTGVRAEDEHPLRVRKVTELSGVRVFDCETTGPVTRRTLATGRVVDDTPRWSCFKTADDLLPAAAQHQPLFPKAPAIAETDIPY